jgi:UPF0755 protein
MKRRFILVAILLLTLAGSAAWLAWALLVPYAAFPPGGVILDISRGTSRRGVARLLEQQGVVRSALAFELLARWRSSVELQAGEYRFAEAAAATEVFRKIAEGRVFVHPLIIPEGLNMFEVASRVAQEGLASSEEFLRVARDPSLVRDLAPQAKSLEGFLFPATYGFPRSVTAAGIAAAMVARFRQALAAFPEEGRNPHGLSIHEAVTLASLVEEETGQRDERPLIAGVFYNRLAKRIALQCDPTVLYAMQLAGKNDGVIHVSDLRLVSPYNTYRHRGLPPGPISNPGQAALRAVLFPPQTDYLYFVADTEGGHFFSRTLAEHNANVAKYRRLAGLPPKPAAGNNGAAKRPSPASRPAKRRSR